MSTPVTGQARALEAETPSVPTKPSLPHPALIVVGLTLILSIVLAAFALPAIKAAPHGVPIGVAGPPAATAAIEQNLAKAAPDAVSVMGFADEAALTAAIKNREVYGGIVVSAEGPRLLTATAASPAVAQLLTQAASGMAQVEAGAKVSVVDVVPLPKGDPRGAGLASSLLPLLIGSMLPVIAMSSVVRTVGRRWVGVLATAVTLGASIAALLHWFGAFEGSWLRDAAAMAAVIAAMSTALLGLHTIAGMPGLGLGAATFMLLGNPLSGLASAPEFLGEPWRSIGAWLPPGAGGQLVRSSAYFEGAGAMPHLIVLACWFAFGAVLIILGRKRAAA